MFGRLAESRLARGDEELAEIITEDTAVMSEALVSVTRLLTPVRKVLLVAVAVVEPVLSFQRILRVLGRRFAERRMEEARAQPDPGTYAGFDAYTEVPPEDGQPE
jgi:hypothetical protein